MESELQALITRITEAAIDLFNAVAQPVVLYQLGLVVVLLVVAQLIANKLEPALEVQARTIKGKPGLLRFVIAALRRTRWAIFVLLLLVSIVFMQGLGWPSSYQLTYIVFLLALAWLIIRVLSTAIRSRFIARIIAIFGWSYVALTIMGISDDAALFLDSAGFTLGTTRISVLLIVKSIFFLGVTLWLAFFLGNGIERRIQDFDELTPSLRVLIGKIVKISLIFIAVLVAVSGIGIDLTVFTVLSGAIGVGIGFGLQKVVSNFISGIIILTDRSIKPGDTISLGETFGWIRELRARFVSVVTRDGREYLIPNEDFITQQVINWSFSDEFVRLEVKFGVSYQSDPHQVIELSTNAVMGVDRVVEVPKPVCWLTGFGDSSLDFAVRFWIRDPQNGLTNIRGKVLLALWDVYKENNIQIPYPHRHLIVDQDSPLATPDRAGPSKSEE